MGLVLCAYFAIDENPTTHFDILDSDITYGLVYHLQTNVGSVRPLVAYHLTKENLVMLQQGGCILLSYEGRGSFQNCLNQVSCIKASFRADCPGLKVEKCGLRLLYHYDLEEFEQTISHSMNSSLDGWNIICQGTSSRTSSSIGRSLILEIWGDPLILKSRASQFWKNNLSYWALPSELIGKSSSI